MQREDEENSNNFRITNNLQLNSEILFQKFDKN